MAVTTTDKLRNVGLFGHGHSGKTMLSEAMMFAMGVTTRLGKIDDGSTLSDYSKQEQERQISIASTLLRGGYKDHIINVLDTPGFSDFIGEVVSALRAVDIALLAVDGSTGHDIGHSRVFELAQELGLPRLFFVTKLDREHVKWEGTIDGLREEFGTHVQVIDFPVNAGLGFTTIGSALTMKQCTYATDGSGKVSVTDLSGPAKEKAEELRAQLIEQAAESDDELLNKFFEHGTLSDDDLDKGIRLGFARGTLFPVLCGAGSANIGTSRLLDFLVSHGPSPLNRGGVKAQAGDKEIEIRSSTEDPMSGLVFKTTAEAHVGELSFIRMFSGQTQPGAELQNPNTGKGEKIGQIFYICGKNRIPAEKFIAGDLGAMVKLKATRTGDTLCDKNRNVQYPAIAFPSPVLENAIVPKTKGDEDKIASGLNLLHAEDPSFTLVQDAELGQMVLRGQGDLHLLNILARLHERYHVDAELIEPRVPYRETIRGSADAEGKHKKQSGGRGQFGVVFLKLEPKPRGQGYEFVDAIVGGAIPGKFVPAVDKGIQDTIGRGVIAGYPVVDVRVTAFDGKYHDVDSSEMAFKIAGRLGFREAFKKCKPILLEPIFELTVKVPEEFMGDVMGDLSSRRGKIQGMEGEGRYQVIRARVPQKELYRYSTALRSMTQGRGMATQQFDHYEEVPPEIQQKLVAEYVEEKEEE
ncbi:elongation factor G [candidate division KSB1 bacterium]|nr:elongation factor G [candidate division KSB1 bacterium]